MKIVIGSDHAGFDLKEHIKVYLSESYNFELKDCGCYSENRVDYPDFGHSVAQEVINNIDNIGILICGSGNGINMAANKHKGIRAALCWKPEIASLAREHNDANILTLPGRFISKEEAVEITDAFLKANFEGGRHKARIDKIDC